MTVTSIILDMSRHVCIIDIPLVIYTGYHDGITFVLFYSFRILFRLRTKFPSSLKSLYSLSTAEKALAGVGYNKFERGNYFNHCICPRGLPVDGVVVWRQICVWLLSTNLLCIEVFNSLMFIGMSTYLLLITIRFQKFLVWLPTTAGDNS